MVSNASPGTATPKMNWSFIHMWLMCLLTVHAHRMGTWNVPIRPLLTEIWVLKWLVFGWFWGWRTSDTQSAKQKLGKKHTPQSWRPLLPSGCHGALPPAPPHTAISQHVVQQVYVVKTRNRKYYCFYYLVAILWRDALSMHPQCPVPVCLWVVSASKAQSIILSAGGAQSIILSVCFVGGPQGKMWFFQMASIPFLSVSICSTRCQYDVLKVLLKKKDQNLPIGCVKHSNFLCKLKSHFTCYFEPFLHISKNMHMGLFKYAFFIVHIDERCM